ncbi:MAG: glycosyltransferase [Candidatus Aenigmarchaeota archaeon]|nr:glycosyltransferase [Candidatus Aenigmarchaeota archaeon]
MRFSFVIPAYNEEKYLGGCVESVKAQTFKDYEIIISYSQSKDRTLQIAKANGSKVVQVPKSFPGKARNAAAKFARGDYLVFLDADVQVPENFLANTNKILKTGAMAVGYEFVPMENDREIGRDMKMIFNPFNRYTKNLSCCYTVKKTAFDSIGGYDERREVSEDTDISARLARVGKINFTRSVMPKMSVRRFHEMGRIRAMGMYFMWFLLGFVLGAKVKYFHVSDIKQKINRAA